MINAELSYNPYLMETQIRFNGQAPRVNSLVEKYQNMNLQAWINRIPKIFYDEMNGFYFELDFSGTQLDYEDLCNAFRRIGITEESVPIVHKKKLEDRITKQKMMERLLKWLEDNPSRRFDQDTFEADNPDLYDGGYSYVYLHGRSLNGDALKDMSVSVEYVDDTEELKDTDLNHTPILVHITEKTLPNLASELSYFKSRPDVAEEQLFFMIGGMLDQKTISRVIRDLGVVTPKIVEVPDAPAVRKYIEVYPVTAFIKDALDKLRKEAESIGEAIKSDNEQNAISNRQVHEEIDSISTLLDRLKTIEQYLREYSDSLFTKTNDDLERDLLHKVENWRNKKIKISKTEEAFSAAKDFEKDTKQWLLSFAKTFHNEAISRVISAKKDLEAEYSKAQYDTFRPDTPDVLIPEMELIASFYYDLMELKEEQYVEAKEDLIGMFFKPHPSDEKQMVLETTYYYKTWREYVLRLVKDSAEKYLDQLRSIFKEYIDALTEDYLDHVGNAIDLKELEKQETISQMSEEDKLLQDDNKWLAMFNDQRLAIERE